MTDNVAPLTGTLANRAYTNDPDPTVQVSLSGTGALAGDTVQGNRRIGVHLGRRGGGQQRYLHRLPAAAVPAIRWGPTIIVPGVVEGSSSVV